MAQYDDDVLIKEIFSDPSFNCRGKDITPGSVADLAQDISTCPGGLLQRILIEPYTYADKPNIKYRVIAGNRRYAACKLLQWTHIPCKVITGLTEDQAEIINLNENIKRKELNILQEAKAIDKMLARGQSPAFIAKRLDVYQTWVDARIALLKLPKDVQEEAASGTIKQSHIQQLVQLKNQNLEKMYEAVRAIKNGSREDKKIVLKPDMTDKLGVKVDREFRNMSDVFKIQDLIQDAIGSNLGARALAWVIGEISVYDFLKDIKAEADLLQIPWSIPDEYIPEKK
ncbi:MAG: ParB/RepB/Spo0J family partition protein [Patescibacteria group bacterium]|nr:ParB/RepB/Spo0J family partition protein [Patescibacteria group bacterium]MDE2438877.1 ParB/RepB/Spo0J family partition protein [Patescibacteria group bacterium]